MKLRNVVIGVVAIAIVIVAIVVISHKPKQSVSSEPVRIGSTLFLSGDYAVFGKYIQEGAEIALKELKEQGANIEYISEDNQSKAAGIATAAQKLTAINNIDAVFTATIQEVKPSAEIFNKAGIPLLATWDSNEFIKTAGPQVFTIGFSTEDAGKKMAKHAYQSGLKKVALIYQEDEWSTRIAEGFRKEYLAIGGTLVMDEKLAPTNQDFRTNILKAKTNGAEGIYFPFIPGTIAPFIIQANQAGFAGTLMTGDSVVPSDVADAKGFSEGMYFTNLFSEGTDHIAELGKKYNGKEPGDLTFASMGYDAVRTIYQATLESRKENISVAEALQKTKIQGTGTMIDFGGKQYSEKFEKVYKVENGVFVEVK